MNLSKMFLLPSESKVAHANNVEAWVAQQWANESMAILVENMQMAALVFRDFENIISDSGDTVNTRKPGEFRAKNKTTFSNIGLQDITATNIPVVLNQHIYVSFLIRDREQSRAFEDLVTEYLKPAMVAIARRIDRTLLSQAPRFLRTSDTRQAGKLGVDASVASVLATRKNLNDNKCPLEGRKLLISSKDESALLALDTFINADKVGDSGSALREASLGRRLGFDVYMCQNVCSVVGTSDKVTGAINSGNLTAGSTVLTVNGFTGALTVGQWATIAGDMIPQRITARSLNTAGNTISITVTPGLSNAILTAAVVTVYGTAAVNQGTTVVDPDGNTIQATAGYAVGWEMPIEVDTVTNQPQVGQWVQFAANGAIYVVVDNPTATSIQLDRPLEATISNDGVIFIGPNGTYNFAFAEQAIALVTRPMAIPRAGTGATGAIANFANLSVRVVWAYDYKKQGMVITVDMLCGVAILEALKGEVMLG